KLEKEGKKNLTPAVREDLEKLSQQLRVLIDPVIVRRSRIDLKEVKEYDNNLNAYLDLQAGRIDCFVVDKVVGEYILTNGTSVFE
ncbi:MAG: transporter substrate-binding domain-containing protein, partial [Clostridiales bacterium]